MDYNLSLVAATTTYKIISMGTGVVGNVYDVRMCRANSEHDNNLYRLQCTRVFPMIFFQ